MMSVTKALQIAGMLEAVQIRSIAANACAN